MTVHTAGSDRVHHAATLCGDDVLAALAEASPEGLTVSALAAATGRDRGLISRLIPDLVAMELVDRDPQTRRLTISWTLAALARRLVDVRLWQSSDLVLTDLATETGHTTYVAIRRGLEAVTVAEAIPPVSTLQVMSWVGRSFPVARSDFGPVLLSGLPEETIRILLGATLPPSRARHAPRTLEAFLVLVEEARRQGYSILNEQADEGVSSVAVPVRDFQGRLAACLGVTGPTVDIQDRLGTFVPQVLDAAAAISASLGATER